MYCDGNRRAPRGQARLYQGQYDNAKQCAKQRGIDWQFTYATWTAWWSEDITKRGPYKGQLVMARHNDVGPYHPNNVRKATCQENGREGQLGKPKSIEQIEKYKQSAWAQRGKQKECYA
jgi:hypothetical protein